MVLAFLHAFATNHPSPGLVRRRPLVGDGRRADASDADGVAIASAGGDADNVARDDGDNG